MRVRAKHGKISSRGRLEAGQVLMTVALTLPVLVGFLGLAVDVGSLYFHKRNMQTASDAAALGGGNELWRGNTSEVVNSALQEASTNAFSDGNDGVEVSVYHPPTSGYYVGNSTYVEVIIQQPSPTYFMRFFGWNTVGVAARAVAGAGGNSQNCLYVLDPTMEGAFEANSNAQLNASCGVVVNSNDPAAMRMTSSTVVTTPGIGITGDYELLSSAVVSPEPTTGVPPTPDPLAYLQPPSYGGCTETNFTRDSGTHYLSPGVYCGGIFLENNAHAILDPGVYVLLGGGLRVVGNTIIEGTGVTIYNTEGAGYPYQPFVTESNAQVHLSAPTTGEYAGILFWQDRNAGSSTDVNTLQSSSNLYLEGALYFPTQELFVQSSVTADAPYSIVVARRLRLDSSSNFTMQNDYSGLPGGSPIKRLSLVE